MRAALYARVSTLDQNPENQLEDLRRYVVRRGWQLIPYIDHGVSGMKDRRLALNEMLQAARKRQIDVVVVWRLDRLGRSLKHLIDTLQELNALGVAFVSLNEGIDATTPAGRLQMHILGAIAEFERERIRERVIAGLARVKARGQRLGRKSSLKLFSHLCGAFRSVRRLGVSPATAHRWLSHKTRSKPTVQTR